MQTKAGIIVAAILIVLIVVAGLIFGFGDPARHGPKYTGQMQNFVLTKGRADPPAETWRDADGTSVSLKDFRGKVVLLNFWASWCAPCLRELPSINALQAKLGGDKFQVVALNLDRNGAKAALPMIERLKLDRLKLQLDPESKVAVDLGVSVMPTTIVYDAAGRELGRLKGAAEWNSPEALELVSYFIDNPDFLNQWRVK